MEQSNYLNTVATVRSQFYQLAMELGADSIVSDKWADQLICRYTEPQRRYHTVAHIYDMLSLLPEHNIYNQTSVKLAIFFHDFIYNPRAKDNEVQSVECFRLFAQDVGLDSNMVNVVVHNIDRTITHTLGDDMFGNNVNTREDLRLFLDFDLKVLSRNPLRYNDYAKQIREEYGHVTLEDYCTGRIGVLESFLRRERLYFSNAFHEQFEDRARANISGEIENLKNTLVASKYKK